MKSFQSPTCPHIEGHSFHDRDDGGLNLRFYPDCLTLPMKHLWWVESGVSHPFPSLCNAMAFPGDRDGKTGRMWQRWQQLWGTIFLGQETKTQLDTHTPLRGQALTVPFPNRCPVFLHPGGMPAKKRTRKWVLLKT